MTAPNSRPRSEKTPEIPRSRVWLITGCSRGLGREIAKAVLAAGHRLVATARATRDLDVLPPSDRLRTVALDVTDAAAARAAVGVATSAFGRLDVVVNNAGFIKANSVEDMPEDDFRRQLEINLFGVYNVTRAALPVMHAQRTHHLDLVHRRPARHARPRRLSSGQVGGGRLQRGAGARGRAARHPRHVCRARRKLAANVAHPMANVGHPMANVAHSMANVGHGVVARVTRPL